MMDLYSPNLSFEDVQKVIDALPLNEIQVDDLRRIIAEIVHQYSSSPIETLAILSGAALMVAEMEIEDAEVEDDHRHH